MIVLVSSKSTNILTLTIKDLFITIYKYGQYPSTCNFILIYINVNVYTSGLHIVCRERL